MLKRIRRFFAGPLLGGMARPLGVVSRLGASPLVRMVPAAVLVVLCSAVGSYAADGFLEGLARAIDAAGRVWGPALLVLGGLVAGGAIAMGSHNAGEKVRNYLLGAIFLVLAAGGGAVILSKLQGLIN